MSAIIIRTSTYSLSEAQTDISAVTRVSISLRCFEPKLELIAASPRLASHLKAFLGRSSLKLHFCLYSSLVPKASISKTDSASVQQYCYQIYNVLDGTSYIDTGWRLDPSYRKGYNVGLEGGFNRGHISSFEGSYSVTSFPSQQFGYFRVYYTVHTSSSLFNFQLRRGSSFCLPTWVPLTRLQSSIHLRTSFCCSSTIPRSVCKFILIDT